MIALLTDLFWSTGPFWLLFGAFAIWMFIDALRRREWFWAVFIFVFPILNAPLYFFLVYRTAGPVFTGFKLPGTANRRRIRELQDQIHHLDKAHLYTELGDIYFQQGKLAKAEACYRSALERDPNDVDTLARYGQCLLRQNRPAEALQYLERACASEPDHDHGQSMIALAESYTALDRTEEAIRTLHRVLEQHCYAKARVQLAELHAKAGQYDAALAQLQEVLSEHSHAPDFQRKRERIWIKRAHRLLREVQKEASARAGNT